MRYFLELSYNGKAYHGWQNQPNAITVQAVLEKSLSTLLKESISIVGAGRTDTGVHAANMYAHFDFEGLIPSDLVYKLNALLPKDIAISKLLKVKEDAHARFDAKSRTYHYRMSTSKSVFNFDYAYQLTKTLNVNAMNEACKILFEYKDFQCFSKVNTDVKTYNCEIKEAQWHVRGEELLFVITADRFLRNMVRAIVGTMINIGLGKIKPKDLHGIIESKDRAKAGYSVPAHGLNLVNILYPEKIFIKDTDLFSA
ncbi:tRNA pseudouridine(38-40) synthase TruA [Winogradskyella alexanderae]|uniref:tRNA pseudouridine synthase A n=1 Tax=Winogradskyella alexanderae TaxID=2877123 RepID=A0ABS7XWR4_9FLAO|nr:tRNA pseudouridine(38-40) synthase TruA [Winogradskyella alexanderae]MCA0133853.1 tRNA pseudouridine(38-40) synthase TruA [Winogradskyella alexanderae]